MNQEFICRPSLKRYSTLISLLLVGTACRSERITIANFVIGKSVDERWKSSHVFLILLHTSVLFLSSGKRKFMSNVCSSHLPKLQPRDSTYSLNRVPSPISAFLFSLFLSATYSYRYGRLSSKYGHSRFHIFL